MQRVILVFSLILSGSCDRLYIAPSIAITHRIYYTETPASFKQPDDNWPKFFIGVPELQAGFNF